ncbi:SURF1 family protein [Paucibacter sp. R3-3]|uniref:SURF1-like protein n=1 Tax=Roseateles agri TaxID=3098619 RepID=A0ABU5DFU0_9BURK|nr:SURF1 family protein [Paucibacter sp. R3-3]MDY0745150.1 SURF1 family protein [Paucibacter sp. R3-3]
MLALLALLFFIFVVLCVWQVERQAWKLALIDKVEQRVHAAPVALPASFGDDEYLHVRVAGRYRYDAQVFTQAVTEKGAGFWVMTPLALADGTSLLVNRGFVPPESREAVKAGPEGGVQLTGLLRVSEPGGGFLRKNDPAGGRWFSRDVAAIAVQQGLQNVRSERFLDLDAGAALPIGGLTVISFHNSHLVYALTWAGLALMCLVGAAVVLRQQSADA